MLLTFLGPNKTHLLVYADGISGTKCDTISSGSW
jgi:hypothetical protein